MMYCYRLIATTLFAVMLVVVGAYASDGQLPTPEQITVAPEPSSETETVPDEVGTEAVPHDAEPLEGVEDLRGEQSRAPASCTYQCDPNHFPRPLCPFVPDAPPPQCINGCCVYDTGGCDACAFDSDCGAQASCWSGCCYYWN